MKKIAKLFPYLSEFYILVLVLAAGVRPPFSFTPLALVMTAIVALQMIFRNAITGIILSNSFILINLYMILALLSEYREFPTFNFAAAKLLIIGSLIILTNLFIGGLIFLNYLKRA